MQKLIKSYVENQKGKERFSAPTAKESPNYKPGVYALRQDGMPCIVPNTADIAAIPNAMPQKQVVRLGKIPNATPQTGEELRRNQRQFFAPPSR
jgi:hypothetical protein